MRWSARGGRFRLASIVALLLLASACSRNNNGNGSSEGQGAADLGSPRQAGPEDRQSGTQLPRPAARIIWRRRRHHSAGLSRAAQHR